MDMQTSPPAGPSRIVPLQPAVAPLAPDEAAPAGRFGLRVLAIGLGGFLLWGALAPLDEGVPSPGTVSIDTKRKPVQHLAGGIVREVLVREGEVVQDGQPLVRLDEAATRASHDTARQRYLGLRAAQSRLLAEQADAREVVFHPELQREAADPLVRRQMDIEARLFAARRAALAADLQGLREAIAAQHAQQAAIAGMSASRRAQLDSLNEELGHTRELVREGYTPRNRQLELERMAAEARSALAELRGNGLRAQSQIAELRQRGAQREQEYRKEVEGQLAEVSREVEAGQSRYLALRDDLRRMEIRSPAAGQVVGLAVQAPGAVLAPGQKLMDIVPADEPLLLESRVAPHLIDRIRAGMPVDVRFAAFAHSPQLVVDGQVLSVSSDLLTETQTNVPYYLARVRLTEEGRRQLGARALQPGMPVEVIFRTGERTLLAYLLHPLSRRLAASMKEE